MIRTMLKPFFKKFFGLFICMVFVSMLSVGLLCAFGSSIINTSSNYHQYLEQYGNIDELYVTSFSSREKINTVSTLQEVEEIYPRLTIDAYLKKEDKTILSRLFTYSETDTQLFKLYVLEEIPAKTDLGTVNISVTRKFANNNNFKLGQTIKIGYFGMYIDCYINQIVSTAESIYPRVNNYVWSDNYDFGYIYLSERAMDAALKNIGDVITTSFNKEVLEELIASAGITGVTIPNFSDYADIINEGKYVELFANQILIKNAKGYTSDEVIQKVNTKLVEQGVAVTSCTKRDLLAYVAYMNHAIEQIRVAAVFLPVFFYSVTMIVVGLFINQIIKAMTPQIGILMSIGVNTNDIVKLFMIFTTIMGIVSGFLGSFVGFGLNVLLSGIMKETYGIPTINPTLNVWVSIGAIVTLLLFIVITTLITCRSIFKITPKDAVISNEAKRKPLPKTVEKAIDKSPMNIKLGLNSIFQNPKRFFVSTFAIFASLVLILLSSLFSVSKDEMIDQSLIRRMQFDCQIYMSEKVNDDFANNMLNQDFVTEVETCYYTYVEAKNGAKTTYLECLAVDAGFNDLINIPNARGHGSISVNQEGIIVPKGFAQSLKVKKGDKITINDKEVVVQDISFQYFHPITYLSKEQMDSFGVKYVTSYLVKVTEGSEARLSDYLSDTEAQAMAVFTKSLSKDLHRVFDAINIMVYIMIGFALGMSLIILCIMAQNALMEQKRPLSVMRAIGFTILDVSNMWTLQSISQLILAVLLAVPTGCGAVIVLLTLASNASQTYPFVFSIPVILAAIGFVLIVVILTHLFAMFGIYRWNLADNTRTRE